MWVVWCVVVTEDKIAIRDIWTEVVHGHYHEHCNGTRTLVKVGEGPRTLAVPKAHHEDIPPRGHMATASGPTVVTDAVNGRSALRLAAASQQYLRFPSGFAASGWTGLTVLVVYKELASVGDSPRILDFGTGSTGSDRVDFVWSVKGTDGGVTINNSNAFTGPVTPYKLPFWRANEWGVYGLTVSPAGITWLSGDSVVSDTTLTRIPYNATRTRNYIGYNSFNNPVSGFVDGEIAEMMVLRTALDLDRARAWVAALRAKYGV